MNCLLGRQYTFKVKLYLYNFNFRMSSGAVETGSLKVNRKNVVLNILLISSPETF